MQDQYPTPMPPRIGAFSYLKESLDGAAQQSLGANAAAGALGEAQVTTTAGNSQGEQGFKAAMNQANSAAALPPAPQAQVPALVSGAPVNNEAFLGKALVDMAYTDGERADIAELQRRMPVVQS